MTGNEGRRAAPTGPPWSVDDLADLHAGIFDDAQSARLWREVNADPQARAVLEALEATSIDLAELPPPPMPESVATRIEGALAAESAARTPQPAARQDTPVVDLAAARKRRRRLAGWGTAVVTAAAAAVAIGVLSLPGGEQPGGPSLAEPQQPAPPGAAGPPLTLGGNEELDASMLGKAMHAKDYGPLSDPGKRAGCLAANQASQRQVEGTRQVRINGTKGVLFVLTTGQKGQFRLLAVGTGCAAGEPATLADKTVG